MMDAYVPPKALLLFVLYDPVNNETRQPAMVGRLMSDELQVITA